MSRPEFSVFGHRSDEKRIFHPIFETVAYMLSLNFIGDIVFTLNHVHYNLSSYW